MGHKNKNINELHTGEQFVEHARRKGANISKSNDGLFTKVSTPAGSVLINPTHDTIDKQARARLKKWFKLLGIAVILGIYLHFRFGFFPFPV